MSLANPKTTGTVTIGYIVASVLNRLRNYSMRDFSFLEQVVIEGFTELNLFHLDTIETVYLRMSAAKTIDLPPDFVDYLKIAIPINGKLQVLSRHDKILLPRTFADGADVGNTGDGVSDVTSLYLTNNFSNGQFVGGIYGAGGSDQAYYRIDRERRTIVFSGSVPRAEIVLEYLSSGIKLTGTTIIPREAVPALRAYALWQMIENDPKATMNQKERKKSQYEEQVEGLRYFQSAFTADEYRHHLYRHSKQTPKR
ncbi:MAG: hypothetical protein PF440_05685 [Thiomicrorhabdus sp.]|jgi:hypothetical protein|nr:hypothetical protein [Thiomicrorhabdus sp.]